MNDLERQQVEAILEHLDEHAKPSETETMRMVAEVLATGDKARYAPTEAPNTEPTGAW